MINSKYGVLPQEVYESISIGDLVRMSVNIEGGDNNIEGEFVQRIGARNSGEEKYHKEYFSVAPKGSSRQIIDCMNIVQIEIRKAEDQPYRTIYCRE